MSEQATYHPLARDTEFGHQDNSSQTGVFIAEFSNDEVTFGKIPASNTPNKRYCICKHAGQIAKDSPCSCTHVPITPLPSSPPRPSCRRTRVVNFSESEDERRNVIPNKRRCSRKPCPAPVLAHGSVLRMCNGEEESMPVPEAVGELSDVSYRELQAHEDIVEFLNAVQSNIDVGATTGVEHRIQSCDASDIAYSAFACVKRVIFVNVDGTADMLRYNGSLYTVAFVPHALQVVCELVSTGFQGSEVVILTDFTAQAELQKHVLENFTCWCKGHDRNTDEHDMGDRLSGIQMFSMTDMQVVSNEVVIYCSTASNEFDRHHNQSNLFRASCVARSMVVIVGDVRDSNPTRHEYPTSAHAACKWCRWNNSVVDTNRSSADQITSMVQRGFYYSKFNIAGIIDAFCAHDRLSTE
ncbi:hypothetical protein HRS9139_10532 [Pyrenophora teres f. teres]|nr:hypothetical protein HRS9139_10557 [Pyrenophora teres f. teres]KAE8821952.1 hypothetical protein HRS9139_10532 [Pyrenophora teres f. teres]KAE8849577.1 hypothetical protein PTNB29_10514 [Pyrenophora teres f. teres]